MSGRGGGGYGTAGAHCLFRPCGSVCRRARANKGGGKCCFARTWSVQRSSHIRMPLRAALHRTAPHRLARARRQEAVVFVKSLHSAARQHGTALHDSPQGFARLVGACVRACVRAAWRMEWSGGWGGVVAAVVVVSQSRPSRSVARRRRPPTPPSSFTLSRGAAAAKAVALRLICLLAARVFARICSLRRRPSLMPRAPSPWPPCGA